MRRPPEVTRAPDEFAWIDRLRPLTRGDPRALNLMDDAAVLPSRAGFDLVISTDTMVEGIHFLAGEEMDIIARRLLRTSLSDLAAKAAEAFGYFLTTAWPFRFDDADRDAFIRGLDEDGRAFEVVLLGGDTVSTPGPLTVSATVLGWAPQGRMIRRDGARAGDLCVVCGTVGDGWLGLKAARGEIDDIGGVLASRYRLPDPLLRIAPALRAHARGAADVSDGLLADALHIAEASGLGLNLDLAKIPLSEFAIGWLQGQSDDVLARANLASGGDDYAIVCAIDESALDPLAAHLKTLHSRATPVGKFNCSGEFRVFADELIVDLSTFGWRH